MGKRSKRRKADKAREPVTSGGRTGRNSLRTDSGAFAARHCLGHWKLQSDATTWNSYCHEARSRTRSGSVFILAAVHHELTHIHTLPDTSPRSKTAYVGQQERVSKPPIGNFEKALIPTGAIAFRGEKAAAMPQVIPLSIPGGTASA